MKSIVITIVLMVSFMGTAQTNLNDYKYVVVPKKFTDFKKENMHRTSTLIKHLFTEKGFVTVYDDELPSELSVNRCLGLYADLSDDSSMFTTKTKLILYDCNGKEVMLSQQGKSKKKEYEEAFNEAITNAFQTFSNLSYSYQPKESAKSEEPITVSFKNDVKTVKEKKEHRSQNDPMVIQEATEGDQYYKDRRPNASAYKKASDTEINTGVQKATNEIQASTADGVKAQAVINKSSTSKPNTGILYAQEQPNGYQLVDSTPKIQLKIYKSSMPNVYLAKADDKDGVVYTSDGKWFFEYYQSGMMVVEELNIKF